MQAQLKQAESFLTEQSRRPGYAVLVLQVCPGQPARLCTSFARHSVHPEPDKLTCVHDAAAVDRGASGDQAGSSCQLQELREVPMGACLPAKNPVWQPRMPDLDALCRFHEMTTCSLTTLPSLSQRR